MPRGTKPSFLAKRQEGREKKIKDFCVQFLQSCAVLAVLQTEKVKKDTRPHVEIQIQEMKVSALVDTGAAVSVVSEELFDSMPGREFFREVKLNPGFSVNGVGGKQLEIVGRFIVPFSILGIDARHPFYVIRELNNHGCILGVDLIRALNLCITADSVQLRRALTALDPDHHPIFALADFTVPARSIVRRDSTSQRTRGRRSEATSSASTPTSTARTCGQGSRKWGRREKSGPSSETCSRRTSTWRRANP